MRSRLRRRRRGAVEVRDAGGDPRLARVEAVLFLAREAVSSRRLGQWADLTDGTEARTLVRQFNRWCDRTGRAFRVEETAGGFRLMTRPRYAPWLRRLRRLPAEVRLTPPALETLVVVAYRQPVSRSVVEGIRGVNCGEILRLLMERDLIRIAGRGEELGRPYLYTVTPRFLQVFGLRSLEDLPGLPGAPSDDPSPEEGAGVGPTAHASRPPGSGVSEPVSSTVDAMRQKESSVTRAPLAESPFPLDLDPVRTLPRDEPPRVFDEEDGDEEFEDEGADDDLEEDGDDLEEEADDLDEGEDDEDFDEEDDWEEVEDEDFDEEDDEEWEEDDEEWDEDDEEEGEEEAEEEGDWE